jgi:hypothetical protein
MTRLYSAATTPYCISTKCSSILEFSMSGMPDKASSELRRFLHPSKNNLGVSCHRTLQLSDNQLLQPFAASYSTIQVSLELPMWLGLQSSLESSTILSSMSIRWWLLWANVISNVLFQPTWHFLDQVSSDFELIWTTKKRRNPEWIGKRMGTDGRDS